MNKTKENYIYNLNSILLSAYREDEEFSNMLMSENNSASGIDKELTEEYESIKSGKTFEIPEPLEADISFAIVDDTTGHYEQSFWTFYQLYKKSPDDVSLLKSVVTALLKIKAYKIILEHFKAELERYMNDDPEVLQLLASAYFLTQENYEDALPFYEKLVKLYPTNALMFYRLAFTYERIYQDKETDKQELCAKRAYELSLDNITHTLLARIYYREGKKDKTKECFDKILANNPTPEDKVAYSRFLMKEGKLAEAYGIYRVRFDTGIVAYPKLLYPEKRWNGVDSLEGKTVIVHYEQGFGDSVMFSRYIPDISKLAKKVIFVVQKNLIPIFKSSGYDKYCELLSHEADVNLNIKLENSNRSVMYSTGSGMGKIPHDYHIPLMDTPFLMKESPDKMVHSGGYLRADEEKTDEFRSKYINNNKKIKIGLAYHGTKDSILTYRDISVKRFLPLLKMDGVEFYSFQSDEYADELQELDKDIKITDLGKVFKNFEDTACAMNCMDVIISTDNVVMNLAGALGIKTYALFNKYTESRWYTVDGDDLGWYKSVRPFHAKTFNDWDNLILDVKDALIKDFGL